MTREFSLDHWIDRWINRRKLRKTLQALQTAGLQISTVYDIGANKGRWSRDMSRHLPRSNFFLFEANESHQKKLASRGFPFFICVLGAREEQRRFYSTGGTGDSLYRERTDHYREADYREVTTRTLASLCKDKQLPAPNFIKLDVQGSELDILAGAREMLGECYLVYMECPVLEYNAGAPRFDTYVQFMAELGFAPLQVLEQHLVKGVLTQFDLLFIRQGAVDLLRKER
ncbi:MAG: hypothetical protein RI884_1190 [Pseudomonadota bacterium]|jgi:FkbM family methyltransferase